MTATASSSVPTGAADLRSKVAPIGLIGKGLLYGSLGFLAIDVAMGDRSAGSVSKTGAIERVASAPFGKFLIIVLTVSLIGLVVWKAMEAITGDPIDGSEATDRAKNAVKAVLYAGSAVTSFSILVNNWSSSSSSSTGGSGSGSGSDSQQQAAAVIMDLPAGRWLVLLVGLAAIAYGAKQIYDHTVQAEFMQRIRSLDEKTSATVEMIGRAGFAGRALLMIGVGVFFAYAGIDHDPSEATGLSGLLQELSDATWGRVVLWVIAVGTFAYGVFSLVEAKYRRAR
jgi:hypothetical protein